MSTKTEKKNQIRQNIIRAAKEYGEKLAGKVFLYVYKDEFFEVSFPIDHFQHLTGVESELDKKNFYKKAKKNQLTNQQFYFSSRYPYANAKKKLPCLIRLSELTTDTVCILKDMKTQSIIYKVSLTNLEFTLGLTGDGVNDESNRGLLYPMSLRVKDSAIEKSNDGEIVDFIFSRDASSSKYDNLLVWDHNVPLIDSVKKMIDEKLLKEIVSE